MNSRSAKATISERVNLQRRKLRKSSIEAASNTPGSRLCVSSTAGSDFPALGAPPPPRFPHNALQVKYTRKWRRQYAGENGSFEPNSSTQRCETMDARLVEARRGWGVNRNSDMRIAFGVGPSLPLLLGFPSEEWEGSTKGQEDPGTFLDAIR